MLESRKADGTESVAKLTIRARAKNVFRKLLPVIAPAAFVGGMAVGAGIRDYIAKRHEELMAKECANTVAQETWRAASEKAEDLAKNLNKINWILIERTGSDEKELAENFKQLSKFLSHIQFWSPDKRIQLMRDILEESGQNPLLSLELLSTIFSSQSPLFSGEEKIASRLHAIAELSVQISDKDKEKAALSLFHILHYHCSSIDALDVLEDALKPQVGTSALRRAPEFFYVINNLGLVCNTEMAKQLIRTVAAVSSAAPQQNDEALNTLGAIISCSGSKDSCSDAATKIKNLLETVEAIANSVNSDRFLLDYLRIIAKLKDKVKQEEFGKAFADQLLAKVTKMQLASYFHEDLAFKLLLAALDNKKFDFEKFTEEQAATFGVVANNISVIAGNRASEAVEIVVEYLKGTSIMENNQLKFIGPEPFDGLNAIEITVNKSISDLDRLIENLTLLKKSAFSSSGDREEDYTSMMERFLGLESLLRQRSNRITKAVRKLEEEPNFDIRMARAIELIIDGSSEEKILKELAATRQLLRMGIAPFHNIRPVDYEEGATLVKNIFGSDKLTPERLINFSYAVSVLGKEKTDRLYRLLGLEYFCRYPPELLFEASKNAESRENLQKPLALLVFPKTDWNRVFYHAGSELIPLTQHYSVILTETGSDEIFYDKINTIASLFGKLSLLVINGHGSPFGVSLGRTPWWASLTPNKARDSTLDHLDDQALHKIRGSFVPNPIVVLNSCETGMFKTGIGGTISKMLGAQVFAPTAPVSAPKFIFDVNGRVSQVCYSSNFFKPLTRAYLNGETAKIYKCDK
ncbi:MAG: hypothetical protein QW590_00495 [Candidatus Bilamarchaeaceae archaeon]